MAVTHDCRLFATRVSPHTPMTMLSWCMALTSALSDSGYALVSASTCGCDAAELHIFGPGTYHQDHLKEVGRDAIKVCTLRKMS